MAARQFLRGARWIGILPVLACLLYGAAAVIGALVPVNGGFRQPEGGIPIYIASNGIHADVLVPLRSGAGDWREFLGPAAFTVADARTNYLAFGWGDRAVFIDTPSWGDLTFTTAVKAIFGLNGTVMHVDRRFIDAAEPIPEGVVRVRVSIEQLQNLTRYLEAGFRRDADGRIAKRLPGPGLWGSDVFYPGTGRYSPFLTCNEWLRRGLSQAGIRMPAWSPFAPAILYQAGKGGMPFSPQRNNQ